MIQKFTTKRDTNGNRYTLIIDHEKKTVKKDYNTSWDYSDFVTITKADRRKLAADAENAGYTTI